MLDLKTKRATDSEAANEALHSAAPALPIMPSSRTHSAGSWFNKSVLLNKTVRTKVRLADNLLISSLNLELQPGGLFFAERAGWALPSKLHVVDRLHTAAIWLDSNVFVRSLQHNEYMNLWLYGRENVWTILSHEFKQVHDVRIIDGQLYIVSTSTNEVVRMTTKGEVDKRWKMPGEGDAWHLNSLDVWNGRIVVSAFGRFNTHRGWKGKYENAGILFDLETGETLWEGLSVPHTPRYDDEYERKFICDSHKHLLMVDDGTRKKAISFPGAITRGMAIGQDHIYLGLSSLREDHPRYPGIPWARVAILDRKTLAKVDELELPSKEIYDIIIVPR